MQRSLSATQAPPGPSATATPATCARPHALAAALGVAGARLDAAAARAMALAGAAPAAGRATRLRRAFAQAMRDTARTRHRLRPSGGAGDAAAARARRARGADPRPAPRPPHHWDLVIAPEHDGLRGDNVITLLGSLHPVDDLWLAAARAAISPPSRTCRSRAPRCCSAAPARMRASTTARCSTACSTGWQSRLREDGGSLLATASRRTPAACVRRLRERLRDIARRASGSASERDGRDNPYAGLLGWADRIVCTADSVNMLSAKPARPACRCSWLGAERISGRPRRFVDSLFASGRVRPCRTIWTLAVTRVARDATRCRSRAGTTRSLTRRPRASLDRRCRRVLGAGQ